MSDSPKCLTCISNGKDGQTYKIAGRSAFKCHSCKVIYESSVFTPIEYKWKEDEKAWKSWITSKGIKLKEKIK